MRVAAIGLAFALGYVVPAPLDSQLPPTSRPDSIECARAIRFVKHGGPARALYVVPFCGDPGIQALATAISRLQHPVTAHVSDLVFAGGMTRDDRIFDAAIALARVRGLEPDTRKGALVILASHLRFGFAFGVDDRGQCRFGGASVDFVLQQGELSPDRPPRFRSLLDSLIRDRTLGAPMHMFIRCIAWQVDHFGLPLDVRPDDLHVELVCGYRIRVRNDAPDDAVIEIREDLTGETSKVTVPAGREAEFATSLPEGSTIYAGGPVYVTLQGEDVWRGVTTGWPWWCPPE